ncbi:MAG: ribosome silencing factor [Deltaproteobacteria bacterium]|nr:MAG: ribosome silencing factor [Deltaproteobacteria bacterium]
MTIRAATTADPLPAHLRTVVEAIFDRKGRAPSVLEVTDLLGYTDHLIIVSARSERHAAGITDGIVAALREVGRRPIGMDGLSDHRWSLLDYGDFIVHVFHHPVRLHYDLESMLHEARRLHLDVPEELAATDDLETRMPEAMEAVSEAAVDPRLRLDPFG